MSLIFHKSPNTSATNEKADNLKKIGNQYFLKGDINLAIEHYKAAIEVDGYHVDSYVNLIMAYIELSKLDEANKYISIAKKIDINKPEISFEESKIFLMEKKYNEGFAEFYSAIDKQLKYGKHHNYLTCTSREKLFLKRLMHYKEKPLGFFRDKVILVCMVYGLGDTLMMLRFFSKFKEKYCPKKLIFLCDENLKAFAEKMSVIDEIKLTSEKIDDNDFDYHCATFALPHLIDISPYDISLLPDVAIDESSQNKWENRLNGLPGLKVGLAWGGNPELCQDSLRSIPLKKVSSFFDVQEISWISLQKGVPANQLKEIDTPIIDWTDELNNVYDTALLIKLLDLVITVDTSVVHLAGTLGIPVWLLNRYGSEWRWLKNELFSRWYPSVKIYTQSSFSEWGNVVANIKKDLSDLIKNNNVNQKKIAEQLKNQGNFFLSNHDEVQAIQLYQQATALCPNYVEAFINLGNAYIQSGNYGNVNYCLNKWLKFKPALNQGHILKMLYWFCCKRLKEAISYGESLLEKNLKYPDIYILLSDLYKEVKDYQKAEYALLEVEKQQNNLVWDKNVATHYYLLIKNFELGFFKLMQCFSQLTISINVNCKKLIDCYEQKRVEENKNIFIYTQWGLGDTILFLRFITIFKKTFKPNKIIFQCEASLVSLAKSMNCIDEVYSKNNNIQEELDYYVCLLELPYLLKINLETLSVPMPYISPSEQKKIIWKQKLVNLSGLKVGLVWSGGQKLNYKNSLRSIPLEKFAKLLTLEGVSWISLQKDAFLTKNFNELGKNIIDWTFDINDFEDTAALVESLDLVISIDSSVINLVGAMGREGWVLNRYGSEWRWLSDVERSPWYPSIKIFTQPSLYDWDSVLDQVYDSLQMRIKNIPLSLVMPTSKN
ncbi:MAG: tetratricopeptide repeat protein [Pseudomonadota bacterium]